VASWEEASAAGWPASRSPRCSCPPKVPTLRTSNRALLSFLSPTSAISTRGPCRTPLAIYPLAAVLRSHPLLPHLYQRRQQRVKAVERVFVFLRHAAALLARGLVRGERARKKEERSMESSPWPGVYEGRAWPGRRERQGSGGDGGTRPGLSGARRGGGARRVGRLPRGLPGEVVGAAARTLAGPFFLPPPKKPDLLLSGTAAKPHVGSGGARRRRGRDRSYSHIVI
jgi:hypothetical protein